MHINAVGEAATYSLLINTLKFSWQDDHVQESMHINAVGEAATYSLLINILKFS